MSSLEAFPNFYLKSDYQLLTSDHSYEGSKYQMDLLATQLCRGSKDAKVRHFVVQPGVCSTNISAALVGAFLQYVKIILFYVVFLSLLSSNCCLLNHVPPHRSAYAVHHITRSHPSTLLSQLFTSHSYLYSLYPQNFIPLHEMDLERCRLLTAM